MLAPESARESAGVTNDVPRPPHAESNNGSAAAVANATRKSDLLLVIRPRISLARGELPEARQAPPLLARVPARGLPSTVGDLLDPYHLVRFDDSGKHVEPGHHLA